MTPVLPVTRRFLFRGDSMLPLLEDGDEVWMRALPWERVRNGDLLVYPRIQKPAPFFVVHRLVDKDRPEGARLQGDSRPCFDDPVPSREAAGRAVALRRGVVVVALDSRRGRAWNAFARLYGRFVLSRIESRFLRELLLRPARAVFAVLFPAPAPASAAPKPAPPVRVWALAAVFAAAVLVYSNTPGNGFVWDDHIFVEGNDFVRDPANLKFLADPRFYLQDQGVRAGSRPVFLASLLLDRWCWGGDPAGYHLTNLLLHAANAVWVYLLGLLFLPGSWAVAAGVLFAAHPAASEAVNAVSFRPEPLAAFFLFAGLWTLLRLRRTRGPRFAALLAAAAGLFGLGLLSKESAAVLPLAAALWEGFFPSGSWTARRAAAAAAAFLAVGAAFAAFRAPRFRYAGVGVESFDAAAAEDLRSGPAAGAVYRAAERLYAFDPSPPPWDAIYRDPSARLWTMAAVHGRNLGLLVWPRRLAADRAPEVIRSPVDPRALAGLLALFLLAAAAIGLRRRDPAVAFSAAWIAAALLPVSGVVPLFNPIAERYLYAASAGAAWGGAAALAAASRRIGAKPAWFLLAVLAVAAGARTHSRNADWRSDSTLFESTPPGVPVSPRVFYNRAKERWKAGRIEGALSDYKTALRMHPRYAEAWANLGALFKSAGKTAEAHQCYRKAVALSPHSPLPAYLYGRFLEEEGDREGARAMYERAAAVSPVFTPATDAIRRLAGVRP